jgi:hypothetical protein
VRPLQLPFLLAKQAYDVVVQVRRRYLQQALKLLPGFGVQLGESVDFGEKTRSVLQQTLSPRVQHGLVVPVTFLVLEHFVQF